MEEDVTEKTEKAEISWNGHLLRPGGLKQHHSDLVVSTPKRSVPTSSTACMTSWSRGNKQRWWRRLLGFCDVDQWRLCEEGDGEEGEHGVSAERTAASRLKSSVSGFEREETEVFEGFGRERERIQLHREGEV